MSLVLVILFLLTGPKVAYELTLLNINLFLLDASSKLMVTTSCLLGFLERAELLRELDWFK
jgi:hypothetical protein